MYVEYMRRHCKTSKKNERCNSVKEQKTLTLKVTN